MDFDDVLDEIGEFGRYQITIYLLICLPVLFAAGNSLTYVFTAGVPDYRCFIPECDNVFDPDYSAPWVQEAIPPSDADTHGDTSYKPDLCTRYLPRGNWSTKVCPLGNFTDQIVRCDRWVYAEHENTIVNEVNM
uniref:Uncharacterized protein n=1 Tax=Timema bartmani TaxID=61472 RepID=A0A7R9F1W5_9NEOP|nr:unnamed protein product [Timema bartmani]